MSSSGYSPYHWCLVPECKNTSVKTPEKLWIQVPTDLKMRNTWLKLARRDPKSLSTKSKYYFCEDHFDLENDMENYTQLKIMGSVKRIRMRPNCIPSRFDCQPGRKRTFTESEPGAAFMKRLRLSIIKEIEQTTINETCDTPLSSSSGQDESTEEGYECDECNNKFTGFVYECVQCTHRMCGACDALGCHKHHYVLRIPPHSSKSEAELVRAKVRLALAEAAPEPRADSDTDGAEPWEPPVELKMEFEPDECDPLSTLDPRPPDPARASWTQTLGNITVKVESEDLEPSTSGFSVPSVTPSITSLTPSMLQTTTAHSLTSNRLQNLTQASHSTHSDIPASSANILVPHMATIGARDLGDEMKGTASGGGKRLVVDDRTPKRGRPLKRDIRPRV